MARASIKMMPSLVGITHESPSLVPDTYSEYDALTLVGLMTQHIDKRFLALDVSLSSKKNWALLSQKMRELTKRDWTGMECQRVWRFLAYGIDIGTQDALLPDSDGEDDPKIQSRIQFNLLSAPHSVSAALAPAEPYSCAPAFRARHGLSDVEHAVVDGMIRQFIGPEPVLVARKRTPVQVFSDTHMSDASDHLQEKVYEAAAALDAAALAALTKTKASGPAAEMLVKGLQDAARAHSSAVAQASDVQAYLQGLYEALGGEDKRELQGQCDAGSAACARMQARWCSVYEGMYALSVHVRLALSSGGGGGKVKGTSAGGARVPGPGASKGGASASPDASPDATTAASTAAGSHNAGLPLSKSTLRAAATRRQSSPIITAATCHIFPRWAAAAKHLFPDSASERRGGIPSRPVRTPVKRVRPPSAPPPSASSPVVGQSVGGSAEAMTEAPAPPTKKRAGPVSGRPGQSAGQGHGQVRGSGAVAQRGVGHASAHSTGSGTGGGGGRGRPGRVPGPGPGQHQSTQPATASAAAEMQAQLDTAKKQVRASLVQALEAPPCRGKPGMQLTVLQSWSTAAQQEVSLAERQALNDSQKGIGTGFLPQGMRIMFHARTEVLQELLDSVSKKAAAV